MPRRTTKHTPEAPASGADRDLLRSLSAISGRFRGFRPAREVLAKAVGQPTIFPSINRATRIGGWPIGRITTIHGPSNHGKTLLAHGLGFSFLGAGGFYNLIDAEHTTPQQWLVELGSSVGRDVLSHPGFVASRPTCFEEVVDNVRQTLDTIGEAKAKGSLASATPALIVIDSIRKLSPKNLLAKLLKDGAAKAGADGMNGRGGQYRAALVAQWLDELVPLAAHVGATIAFIAREYEKPVDVGPMGRKPSEVGEGQDYRIGGGKALVFDSSMLARVTRSFVYEGAGEDKEVVGERHTVRISKTKVAGKDGKYSEGWFHTSNGKLTPAGFDRARDLLELAISAGVVRQKGAWVEWPDVEKWNGRKAALLTLSSNVGLLDTLEGELPDPSDADVAGFGEEGEDE